MMDSFNHPSLKLLSYKQRLAILWWADPRFKHLDAVLCHGAVRSGKTFAMSLGFVLWASASFSGHTFAICGKTISSVRRNLVDPLLPLLSSLGFSVSFKSSQALLSISKNNHSNKFLLFGGKDESSASLIQGITLAGVLLDEVALMPRSFVEQALARCSVSGSRFWFNCNPQHPGHWFFKEWILNHSAKSLLPIHFSMDDNPSLSTHIKKRYHALYSGVFFQRFVLGKWVAPSGLVYPMFSTKKHVVDINDVDLSKASYFVVSCDYGTVNPTSFGLWAALPDSSWLRVRELYYDSKITGSLKTDQQYFTLLSQLIADTPVKYIICDPSAASFIQTIRSNSSIPVILAKNDVLSGIRRVASLLQNNQLLFSSQCSDSIREFSLYRWDDSLDSDYPKKEFDHAMDDIRYLVNSLSIYPHFFVSSQKR